MNSELAEMMFDVLSKRIGTEVTCVEWLFGSPMEVKGILEEVIPFDKVTISKTVIPFVGERQAIEKITMEEKAIAGGTQPKTIYSNPMAVGYDRKGEEVKLAQKEMLGYSTAMNGSYEKIEDSVAKRI